MNSLSNERLLQRLQQFEAAGKEARAIEDDEFAEECEDIASVICELLASREAQSRPLAWVIDANEYDGNGELTHLRDVDYEQEDIDELPAGTKLYAALPLSGVFAGWVMVPIEPTEDMIIYGFESDPEMGFGGDLDAQEAYEAMSGCQQAAHRAKLCWAAMLAGAPLPPPLTITLPDPSSKAFWSGSGKSEQFHPETYKRWTKEAIERYCLLAGVNVSVS